MHVAFRCSDGLMIYKYSSCCASQDVDNRVYQFYQSRISRRLTEVLTNSQRDSCAPPQLSKCGKCSSCGCAVRRSDLWKGLHTSSFGRSLFLTDMAKVPPSRIPVTTESACSKLSVDVPLPGPKTSYVLSGGAVVLVHPVHEDGAEKPREPQN